MKIPSSIITAYDKLVELCEEYPLKIPLEKAAEFLSMDKEGLRSSIERGHCQFGLCVQKSIHGNRAFTINTIAFYNWVTCGAIFQTLKVERVKEGKIRKYKAKRAN